MEIRMTGGCWPVALLRYRASRSAAALDCFKL
jgi:hypothetical protein